MFDNTIHNNVKADSDNQISTYDLVSTNNVGVPNVAILDTYRYITKIRLCLLHNLKRGLLAWLRNMHESTTPAPAPVSLQPAPAPARITRSHEIRREPVPQTGDPTCLNIHISRYQISRSLYTSTVTILNISHIYSRQKLFHFTHPLIWLCGNATLVQIPYFAFKM